MCCCVMNWFLFWIWKFLLWFWFCLDRLMYSLGLLLCWLFMKWMWLNLFVIVWWWCWVVRLWNWVRCLMCLFICNMFLYSNWCFIFLIWFCWNVYGNICLGSCWKFCLLVIWWSSWYCWRWWLSLVLWLIFCMVRLSILVNVCWVFWWCN